MGDEKVFGDAIRRVLQECIQEHQREQFRAQLKERNEATLRRRKKADQIEGGDATEEKWRTFLHRPVADANIKIISIADIGNRARRVLSCQVSMSVTAAN